jgi:hypothetical protein
MRIGVPLVAALALLTVAACGGDDEAAIDESLPIAQRVLAEEDAPGSKPDPVEKRMSTADFDEFIEELGNVAIDPDTEEMTRVFEEDGFEEAVTETRFFGEMHSPEARHVRGSVIQLQSDRGARSALDWLETDIMKPCPETCAVRISEFEVDGIPDARGVHASASAEDIEAVGSDDEQPFDSYWIGFTDGSSVYTVHMFGPPGSVSEEQASTMANAYYERIADLPS